MKRELQELIHRRRNWRAHVREPRTGWVGGGGVLAAIRAPWSPTWICIPLVPCEVVFSRARAHT